MVMTTELMPLVVGDLLDQVVLLNFPFKFLQHITTTHPKNIQWAL